MPKQRILFCRIDWAEKYDGSREDIKNRKKRPKIHCEFGHEIYNFRKFKDTDTCYGFVELQNNKKHSIRIERILGATRHDESLSDVLVVWVATKPKVGGTYVVGWYKDATVYIHIQTLSDKIWKTKKKEVESNLGKQLGAEDLEWLKQYRISCKQKDAVLVPCGKRIHKVESFGQANIWYGDKDEDKETVAKVIAYIKKYSISN